MTRVLSPGEIFSLLHCAETVMQPPMPVGMVVLARGPLMIFTDGQPRISDSVFVDMAGLPGRPQYVRLTPCCEHVRVTAAHAYGFEVETEHDYVGEWILFGYPIGADE